MFMYQFGFSYSCWYFVCGKSLCMSMSLYKRENIHKRQAYKQLQLKFLSASEDIALAVRRFM